jgi:hypothetical protein
VSITHSNTLKHEIGSTQFIPNFDQHSDMIKWLYVWFQEHKYVKRKKECTRLPLQKTIVKLTHPLAVWASFGHSGHIFFQSFTTRGLIQVNRASWKFFWHKIYKNMKVISVRTVESVERPPYWIAKKFPLNCHPVVFIILYLQAVCWHFPWWSLVL